MPQILIRAHKNPFTVADADTTYRRNLIGNNTGNLVFSQAVYRLLSTSDTVLKTSGLAGSQRRAINSRFDHVVIPLANAFRLSYVEPRRRGSSCEWLPLYRSVRSRVGSWASQPTSTRRMAPAEASPEA